MFRRFLKRRLWLVLPIAASLARAQEIDTAVSAASLAKRLTIFDDIQDAHERSAFREVWGASEPAKRKELAVHFVEMYPGSIVLKEAYEIAARACVAMGNLADGLDWANRSLRLMPENPFLLVMAADIAAKLKQLDLAGTRARDGLRYLEYADSPAPIAVEQWPRTRDALRETAYFVLGRVAASQEKYEEAERWLLGALRLNADDAEALYTLGVVRMAVKRDREAAPCFAKVMKINGPLSEAARLLLRRIFDKGPRRESQSFEDYAAALKWTPPEPERPAPAKPVDMRYAGSEACRGCHAREYENWQSTGMAKMFRPYRASDVIGDFSGRQIVSGSARAVTEGDRRAIEIREGDSSRWIRYPVDYIIGSKWQQAYATRLPNGEFLVLPIQYSRLESAWVNYWKVVDGPGSQRADISRFHENPDGTFYQQDCAPCHTSQLQFQNSPRRPKSATFAEGGINCEMCHGPSLAHVESMKKNVKIGSSAAEPQVNFKRISAEQYVAICAQCHMQSAVHDAQPDGAVNYSKQGPFYRSYSTHLLSDFSRRAFYKDGRFRATTFIVEAFTRSQCFRKGGATCGSCHNPHPADAAANAKSLKFGEDSDQMCVQCHTPLGEHPERHTHHAAGTEASRCVSCHMPRIMDAVLFRARSHQIDDIPDVEMTERFGASDSPNACLTCHRQRDTAWLRSQMATLWPRR